MPTLIDKVLLVSVVGVELAVVALTMLTLSWYPAPVLGRMSLRRRAKRLLRPADANERRLLLVHQVKTVGWSGRFVLYAMLIGALWLPIQVPFSILSSSKETGEYLGALWQVVAAALGLSVAMVAFAFQAFSSSRERSSHAGTLREFAYASFLVVAIEVGLLSLAVDGIVLFGPWGLHHKGWAGAVAIVLSAITLAGVVLVVHRILRQLDDRVLTRMRERRLAALIREAIRAQLISQAADRWLADASLPVERQAFVLTPGYTLSGRREGWLADIRLGPLLRWQHRAGLPGKSQIRIHAGVGNRVSEDTTVMSCLTVPSPRAAKLLRAAFVVRTSLEEPADQQLLLLIEHLHGAAMDAARSGHEREWRSIAASYEAVLLGLPRASRAWGFPYEGALMSPGFFGRGPVHRIRDYLYDELTTAVANNHRSLVSTIAFFPQRVSVEAARLGAPSIATPMLSLYPAMYRIAMQG